VLERGQDLALLVKAAREVILGPGAATNELERDALAESAVVALGEVDHAHPPASRLADDPVGADPRPRRGQVARGERARQQGRHAPQGRLLQEVLGRVAGAEELLDVLAQVGVPGAGAIQVARALLRRQVEGGVEDLFDLAPAFVRRTAHAVLAWGDGPSHGTEPCSSR
jgi:hypothetical protein